MGYILKKVYFLKIYPFKNNSEGMKSVYLYGKAEKRGRNYENRDNK